jgi:hypothetical protein
MKWLLRAALWFAFGHAVIVACSDAAILEPREEGDDFGTGGSDDSFTPGSGGRSGGGSVTKPPPPKPSTGGRIGAGGSPVPGAGGSPDPGCGPTPWNPQSCANNPAACDFSNQPCITNPTSTKQLVEQGCGYLRFTYYEASGNSYGRVYDQATFQLVHYWASSGPPGCGMDVSGGTMPGCFSWSSTPCGGWWGRQDAGSSPPVDASTD